MLRMKKELDIENFGTEPIFLPDATKGAVRFVTYNQLEEIEIKGIVINTLHLWDIYGIEKLQLLGGMHKMTGWKGYFLSDSGGFQIFSLIHSGKWQGKLTDKGAEFKSPVNGKKFSLTPEVSIDVQIALGSDILVCLDDCRDTGISKEDAKRSVDFTLNWAERCKKHFNNVYGGTKKTGKLLSAVVQGAHYPDLREYCAKELSKMDFDGYNFGGYVVDDNGLLVKEEMKAVINALIEKRGFRYAMGVGKPKDIIDSYEIGFKVFDTVLVTRNARHGHLYSFDIPDYDLRIKNSKYSNDSSPVDSTCDCELCQRHSRAYIRTLFMAGEGTALSLMSLHNLRFYTRLIKSFTQNKSI